MRALDGAGIETAGLGLRRPSLDDVFLALTGHAAEEEDPPGKRKRGSRGRRRTDRARSASADGASSADDNQDAKATS